MTPAATPTPLAEPPITEVSFAKLIKTVERCSDALLRVALLQERFTPYLSYETREGERIVIDMRTFRKVRINKKGGVHLYPMGGGNNEVLDAFESSQIVKTLSAFVPTIEKEK